MEYLCEGGPDRIIDMNETADLIERLVESFDKLERVLILPPDFTRYHSGAGPIVSLLYANLVRRGTGRIAILPALGTHSPMTSTQKQIMFPGVPPQLFVDHNWREDIQPLGKVPGEFIKEISGGRVDYHITCEVNKLLVEENWDVIFSVGQLVPHEVIGIANYNKNVFVGTGGKDTINKTHFLGAVCDMEKIMGRERSPVRDVLNYMSENFAKHLPIVYVLTVRDRVNGEMETRGLYAGDDEQCYFHGAKLSQQCNLKMMPEPMKKVFVYLDESEFKSTWLGNKAIYRTRMAIADDGELIVLAPGVMEFGEDKEIDRLIRKYGYKGTDNTLQQVQNNPEELGVNLSAAAHLIHGSSEGRFKIIYCPGHLTREEIENAGYEYGDLSSMLDHYQPEKLNDGWNTLADGEKIFYISNPALGLWALEENFL